MKLKKGEIFMGKVVEMGRSIMYLIGAPKAGQQIMKQTNISNYNSVKLSEKEKKS